MTTPANIPVINLGMLYANNAQVSWASATTLTIQNGQVRDASNTVDISVTSGPVTLNFAVNGLNGLDTSAIAVSSWYYIYEISSSTNRAPAGYIASLSASGPTVMPFNYDAYQLISIWNTDSGGNLLLAYETGNGMARKHFFDTSISVLSGGTSATLAPIDLSAAVPPIQNTPVFIFDAFTPATANDYVSYFAGDSTATVGPRTYGSVAAKINGGSHEIVSRIASSKAEIKYINSAASGATSVWVYGFEYYI